MLYNCTSKEPMGVENKALMYLCLFFRFHKESIAKRGHLQELVSQQLCWNSELLRQARL